MNLERKTMRAEGSPSHPAAWSRSRTRYLRAVAAIFATLLSRVGQLLIGLVSVRVALEAYGPDRYGLWLTLSAFLLVAALLDQGLGYQVVQGVAEAEGSADPELGRAWISTALAVNIGIASAIMATVPFQGFLPWALMLGVAGSAAESEATPAVMTFIVCFCVNLVTGIVQKVQAGLQLGGLSAAWQLLGSGLALVGTLLAAHWNAPLPWLVASQMGAPAIAVSFAGALLFSRRPDLRPSLRALRRSLVRKTVKASAIVGTTAAAGSMASAFDNLMIAHTQGVSAVAAFALPWRLFSLAQSLLGSISQALWPAYAEALARRDNRWAVNAFLRALAVTGAGATLCALVLYTWRTEVLTIWIGPGVPADADLFIAFGALLVLLAIGSVLSHFLVALGAIRAQAVLSLSALVCVLPLKWVMLRAQGSVAIPWTMAAVYGLVILMPSGLAVMRSIRSLTVSESDQQGQD